VEDQLGGTSDDDGTSGNDSMNDISLLRADESDHARVESLLAANDLPHRDVRDAAAAFFLAYTEDGCVGLGGIERHESRGLLRSLVVPERYRGRGYGTALCDALEQYARRNGVETLYLLTTTAAPFFRGRGYERVEREAVPDGIRDTAEFTDLCPASATCLAKDLGR
jgi:amino-acid N-acetyltransferase